MIRKIPFVLFVLCCMNCSRDNSEFNLQDKSFENISIIGELSQLTSNMDYFQFGLNSNPNHYLPLNSTSSFHPFLFNYSYSYQSVFTEEPSGYQISKFIIGQYGIGEVSIELFQKPYDEDEAQPYKLFQIRLKANTPANYFDIYLTNFEYELVYHTAHIILKLTQEYKVQIGGHYINYFDNRELRLGIDTLALVPEYFYEIIPY